MLSRSICLVALLAVVGCNSGVTAPKPFVLQLPVAAAGLDQTAGEGSVIVLDGSGSTDPQGGLLTYRWVLDTVPMGSNAELSDPLAAKTEFYADTVGRYVARLTVSNGTTWSKADTVTITIRTMTPDPSNKPPTAVARIEGAFKLKEVVTLDGSGSTDPEGGQLSYYWSIYKRPEGSNAQLRDHTAAKSTFIPDKEGEYIVRLVVSDGQQAGSPAYVIGNTIPLCSELLASGEKIVEVGTNGSIQKKDCRYPDGSRSIHLGTGDDSMCQGRGNEPFPGGWSGTYAYYEGDANADGLPFMKTHPDLIAGSDQIFTDNYVLLSATIGDASGFCGPTGLCLRAGFDLDRERSGKGMVLNKTYEFGTGEQLTGFAAYFRADKPSDCMLRGYNREKGVVEGTVTVTEQPSGNLAQRTGNDGWTVKFWHRCIDTGEVFEGCFRWRVAKTWRD